jgi:hypothetical protein
MLLSKAKKSDEEAKKKRRRSEEEAKRSIDGKEGLVAFSNPAHVGF